MLKFENKVEEKHKLQTTPTTAELSVASEGGSSPAVGTAVDMGRSAVPCESGGVVGRLAMNESGRSEGVTQPTVAEAAAGVVIPVGDTQSNSEQPEVPLVVSTSGRVSPKKHTVSMSVVLGISCSTGHFSAGVWNAGRCFSALP